MTLHVRGGRFVVRPDDHDPAFARWAIEFDGEDYVVGTRSAPREEVYEFIGWLQAHVGELDVSPPPGSKAEPRGPDADAPSAPTEEPGQSYG